MKNKTTIKVLSLLSPYKNKLIFVGISLILDVCISLLIPIMSKSLVDEGIIKKDFEHVIFIAITLFISAVFLCSVNIVRESVRSKIEAGIFEHLMQDAFHALHKVDIKFFSQKNTAEIINEIMFDAKMILQICDSNTMNLIIQILYFSGGLIGLFFVDYRLSLIIIIFIPLKYLLVKTMSNQRKTILQNLMNSTNQLSHWLGDNISGIKEIRLFGIFQIKLKELKKNIHPITSSERRMSIIDKCNESIDNIFIQTIECIAYLLGAFFIFNDSLTIGSLFALISYAIQVINPIAGILNIKFILDGIHLSAERFFNFLCYCDEHKEISGKKHIGQIDLIELKNISFSYSGREIIKNFSFTAKKGQRIAIVGKNGTGKTTLLNILQRFIVPTTGDIFINGINISEVDLNSYRKQLGCVNQVNHLFDMSIHKNIFLYNSTVNSDTNLILKDSGVNAFVSNFIEKEIGIDGCMLSGGQRQKLLLARILAKNSSIYIFDEATTYFDAKSQHNIFEKIDKYINNSISFFIVHDKKLLKRMDSIIFLGDSATPLIFNSVESFMHSIDEESSPFMVDD